MIVLDTHALVWYLDGPQKISNTGRSTIEAGFNGEGVGISDISLWEVAMLVAKSRLAFDRDVGAWLGGLRALPNFQVCPHLPCNRLAQCTPAWRFSLRSRR